MNNEGKRKKEYWDERRNNVKENIWRKKEVNDKRQQDYRWGTRWWKKEHDK